MAILAIKGHATRGKEVIELLDMLGGQTDWCTGTLSHCVYFINKANRIDYTDTITDEACFTLEKFLEKFPYKVGDKVIVKGYKQVFEIISMRWCSERNDMMYSVSNGWFYTEELQPYKEETMKNKPNLLQQLIEYFDNTPRYVLEKEWNELSYLNEIGPTVNEYLECVKKYRQSNQYPKTYVECCEVLGVNPSFDIKMLGDGESTLYFNFIDLVRCRNAYWKMAGEQMGLGKPWKPEYIEGVVNTYYTIHLFNNKLFLGGTSHRSAILCFPTEEMRDAFYENFKDLIEQCKELL